MTKKILTAVVVVGLAVLLGASSTPQLGDGDNLVLKFIKENPDKTAIKLVRNDTTLAAQNVDKMMPLASTVKIIVAIEYAEQAAHGLIDPDEQISLAELAQFYVPNTDGGAHPAWLNKVQDVIEEDAIPIREIAKGMITFSSNANTEWLLEKLGLDNVNNRLDSLGVKDHSPIYHLVSALFVGKEVFPQLTGEELAKRLENLPIEEYRQATEIIHQKLKTDSTYKQEIGYLGLDVQRVWSDNLPNSTVQEYVGIMEKINSRSYFSPKAQEYLNEVMEFVMENPANQEWLEHSGMKGGSTAFVLTKALYATDKEGNTTELAYFINDVSFFVNASLQMSMNEFELKVLSDAAFRQLVQEELGQ